MKKIAEGAFGAVYLAQLKKSGEHFAMKVVDYKKSGGNSADMIAEQKAFQLLNGRFVVNPIYIFTHQHYVCFVMEYMNGGDLGAVLEEYECFPEFICRFYIAEIMLAVEHLHQQGIVHRDLKPENVLLDNDGHIKLSDFGLSEFGKNYEIDEKAEEEYLDEIRVVGTPDYIAPEILLGKKTSKMIDWWSIGCIVYELLVSFPPFNDETREAIFENIKQGKEVVEWPEIGDGEDCMSADAQDLIIQLLQVNPKDRLGRGGLKQVMQHKFFTKSKERGCSCLC